MEGGDYGDQMASNTVEGENQYSEGRKEDRKEGRDGMASKWLDSLDPSLKLYTLKGAKKMTYSLEWSAIQIPHRTVLFCTVLYMLYICFLKCEDYEVT